MERWRSAARNEALQHAVEEKRTKADAANIHFLDLFSPSAALHFGHCEGGDPIHWHRGTFYEEHTKMIIAAAHDLCV